MAIKTIGLTLQGEYDENGVYHMTPKEIEAEKNGEIAVVGTTTYTHGPNGSYRHHEYTIVNMKMAINIDIFYDIEDDYMMDQTIKFNNGESVYGRSRNHKEVELWESMGIPINKSYGY